MRIANYFLILMDNYFVLNFESRVVQFFTHSSFITFLILYSKSAEQHANRAESEIDVIQTTRDTLIIFHFLIRDAGERKIYLAFILQLNISMET